MDRIISIVCYNKAYKDITERIHHSIFEMSTKINQCNSCQLSFFSIGILLFGSLSFEILCGMYYVASAK